MASFFNNDGQQALVAAIASLEELTSAEVVVAVRPSSGHYLHVDMAIGAMAAMACLAALVYGPWPVDWHFLLLDPALLGTLVALASSRIVAVPRSFTRITTRRANVARAAKAEFVDRGVHNTRERTGILLYVSLLERTSTVVADAGVLLGVATEAWQAACDRLRDCVERGGDANALAQELAALSKLLEIHLPRRSDDTDELRNEVVQ